MTEQGRAHRGANPTKRRSRSEPRSSSESEQEHHDPREVRAPTAEQKKWQRSNSDPQKCSQCSNLSSERHTAKGVTKRDTLLHSERRRTSLTDHSSGSRSELAAALLHWNGSQVRAHPERRNRDRAGCTMWRDVELNCETEHAAHHSSGENLRPRFGAAVTFCRAPCNDSAEQATKKPCGGRGLSMIRKNAQSQNQNKMCRNLHKICKSLQKYAILLHIRKLNQLFQSYLHLSRGFYVQSADFYFSYLQFKKNVIELKAEKGKSGDRCNSHRLRFLVRATYQVKRTPYNFSISHYNKLAGACQLIADGFFFFYFFFVNDTQRTQVFFDSILNEIELNVIERYRMLTGSRLHSLSPFFCISICRRSKQWQQSQQQRTAPANYSANICESGEKLTESIPAHIPSSGGRRTPSAARNISAVIGKSRRTRICRPSQALSERSRAAMTKNHTTRRGGAQNDC